MLICPACQRQYPAERTHCERDGVMLVALSASGGSQDMIGTTIDGRYHVDAVIGRGGMGTVYSCRHAVVGKPFAMKVLRPGIEQSGDVLQRFIREAQTANSVRSRHIVAMNDFGQLPSGQFYMVMELLVGRDLGKALKASAAPAPGDRPLSRADMLHIFIQVCDALEQTHQHGIVHRDLKPDNVFLVQEDSDPHFVKLLDFGIAKALHDGPSGLTETGVILGTPYYVSPEQARGEKVDHRTDIYSLGVMMYRAFTGKLPFYADSSLGVITRHLTEAPEPPSRVAGVDMETERVILGCMEKRPEHRFQSMRQVADALRAIAASLNAPKPVVQDDATVNLETLVRSGAYASGNTKTIPARPAPSQPQAAPAYGAPGASQPMPAYGQLASSQQAPAYGQLASSQQAPAYGAPGASQPMPAYGQLASSQQAPAYGAQGSSQPMPAYGAQGTSQPMPAYAAAGASQQVPAQAQLASSQQAPAYAAAGASQQVPAQGQLTSSQQMMAYGGPGAPQTLPHAEQTSHGLASSNAMRIAPPPRRWPLIAGALGMLVAGGAIVATISALTRSPGPASGSVAATSTSAALTAAPTATQAPAATAPASAAPTATEAPSAAASAEPTAAAGAGTKSTAPHGTAKTSPTATTKPTTTSTNHRPPEIRSPFD